MQGTEVYISIGKASHKEGLLVLRQKQKYLLTIIKQFQKYSEEKLAMC